jgi:hypothetical protein
MGMYVDTKLNLKELLWNKVDMDIPMKQVNEQGIPLEIGPCEAYIIELM